MKRRIVATRDGSFRLNLPPEERNVLRALPAQLRDLLASDDPSLVRLFPPAYVDDPVKEAEFRSLVRDDLVARHRDALEVLEHTVDRDKLTEAELVGWSRAINALRLVLGTILDVDEAIDYDTIPDDHPDAGRYAVYSYLTFLLDTAVTALSDR
jgi:hypothetical protein